MRHLPVHPTKRHPHTGAPLRAIYVRGDGRVFWPILGASPDDPPPADDAAKAAADAKAATDKAAADAATAKKAADDAAANKGFPDNTPVAEMTAEQQAAYHRHQSRKHEDRAKGWADAFPGKSAAEIKAIVDKAEADRRNTLTLDDKTLEDERAKVRRETLAEIGPKAVASAFNLLLSDMPEAERSEALDVIDLSKFLNSDNEVDTAKVKAHAARITGPAKGPGSPPRDFGQGRRGNSAPAGTVAAVKEARRQAREDKLKTS